MTKDQHKLLKNVALLVCSLADSKAGRIECDIVNDLCDGRNSHRARGVEKEEKRLEVYKALILETRKLAKK